MTGFGRAELEMLVEPCVKGGSRDGVVVVREMFAAGEHDVVWLAEHCVQLLQFGKAFGGHLLRPVVGRGHAERLGGEQGGELDVAGVDAEERGVFAGAAALHGGADHHGREGERHARDRSRRGSSFACRRRWRRSWRCASGSTSGRLSRNRASGSEFHVCRPMMLCRCASACGL